MIPMRPPVFLETLVSAPAGHFSESEVREVAELAGQAATDGRQKADSPCNSPRGRRRHSYAFVRTTTPANGVSRLSSASASKAFRPLIDAPSGCCRHVARSRYRSMSRSRSACELSAARCSEPSLAFAISAESALRWMRRSNPNGIQSERLLISSINPTVSPSNPWSR